MFWKKKDYKEMKIQLLRLEIESLIERLNRVENIVSTTVLHIHSNDIANHGDHHNTLISTLEKKGFM